MKTFMMSMLVQKYAQATPEAFRQSFAHDTLVWEPGHWVPARSGAPTRLMAGQAPEGAALSRGSEALVLALVPRKDEGRLVLGRDESCDICLNDATLSLMHVSLEKTATGWRATDLRSRNGTWVNERRLLPSVAAVLTPGAVLKAGQVVLRFCSPEELHTRLMELVAAARARAGVRS